MSFGRDQSRDRGLVRWLVAGALSSGVRPWDLPELQQRAGLGEVSSARMVCLDGEA
jgi:hypothetical protein